MHNIVAQVQVRVRVRVARARVPVQVVVQVLWLVVGFQVGWTATSTLA
jgi:hypothetical protein